MKFCSLYSGSSGNCLYLEDDSVKLLIDAGVSGKKVEEGLCKIDVRPEDIDALVISHDHMDHIQGAGVLSRRYNLPIYANHGTWEVAREHLGKIDHSNIKVFNTNKELYINGLSIFPFLIRHDAREPVGFSFTNGKNKIAVITDTGVIDEDVLSNLYDCDLAIVESNHDTEMLKVCRYPYYLKRRILGSNGHLSNDDASKTVLELVTKGLKRVLLAHLSEENNFPELAYETTSTLLKQNNIRIQKDVEIEIAPRYVPSTLFSF